MSKRVITYLVATAAAAAMLPVASGLATSSSAASAGAAKVPVVRIVMRDPGCHWFHVAGKNTARLVVHGKTAFRNLDEAALIFKGTNFVQRVPVGKSLVIARPGVYHIKMAGQHPDDNNLALIVK